ncbi:MAG: trehalose-phosphatase [Peptococcaceae bacterium]|nr:trehalose-phosphatase [Peptococcaceae bacterium]
MKSGQGGRAGLVTPEELYRMLPASGSLLIMLDYDGTLVPIAGRPENARPDGNLLMLLESLAARPGFLVAVISGRGLADLAALLPVEGLILAACHGARIRWPDGREDSAAVPFAAGEGLRALAALAGRLTAGGRGIFLEEKDSALALHYRLAVPAAARGILHEFVNSARHIIKNQGLEILRGKKVLEVRPRGVNKGIAVEKLTGEYAEAFPVYLGDDATDEDAFRALGERGLGVLVARRARRTSACCRLAGVEEARLFLTLLKRSDRCERCKT